MTSISKLLVDFSQKTSGHGVGFIGSAKGLLDRMFWSLVFLVSLGAFIWQVIQLVSRFLEYSKTAQLELKFESMQFPAVTVCNLNAYKASKTRDIPQIETLRKAYEDAFEKIANATLEKEDLLLKPQSLRQKRASGMNDLHVWRCVYEESDKYYRPLSEVTEEARWAHTYDPSSDAKQPHLVCICVNDRWNFLSYCSPVEYWTKMSCDRANCESSRFCGDINHAKESGPGAQVNQSVVPCLCNTEMDGCYNTTKLLNRGLPAESIMAGSLIDRASIESLLELLNDPEFLKMVSDSPLLSGNETYDPLFAKITTSNVLSAAPTKPILEEGAAEPLEATFDYDFLFKGVTDEFALTSKAKETMVYISGELPEPVRIAASATKHGFVQMCSFSGVQCLIDTDFKLHLDPNYGNCYIFNPGIDVIKNATRAGPNYGLRLLLYSDVDEYLFSSDSAGIRLSIHEQSQEPFPSVLGKSAPTGFISSFGARVKKISRLAPPYGECLFQHKNGDYIYKGNYSVEGCYRSCFQNRLARFCGCSDPRFPAPPGHQHCRSNDISARKCIESVVKRYGDFHETTSCECFVPCQQTVYGTTFSASRWPTETQKISVCKPPNNETCREAYRKNAAVVEVYFEQLNYEIYREVAAYTWVNLVADFGGNMGLWLGCSVITCVEFCILMLQLFGYISHKCTENVLGIETPPKESNLFS